jgi:hypothetical protein
LYAEKGIVVIVSQAVEVVIAQTMLMEGLTANSAVYLAKSPLLPLVLPASQAQLSAV